MAAQHDAHEALRLVAGLHASLEAVGAAGPPTEDAHRLQGVTFWRLQGVPAYVTRVLNTCKQMHRTTLPCVLYLNMHYASRETLLQQRPITFPTKR